VRARAAVLAAVVLALAAALPAAAAEGGLRGPGPLSARRAPLPAVRPVAHAHAADRPAGAGEAVFGGLLAFYQRVVSPVDGDRCSMAPTCSLYSRQALARHGVLLGVLLTADRLLHEADEVPHVPRLKEGGETYFVDPLSANTYWLPDWLR